MTKDHTIHIYMFVQKQVYLWVNLFKTVLFCKGCNLRIKAALNFNSIFDNFNKSQSTYPSIERKLPSVTVS